MIAKLISKYKDNIRVVPKKMPLRIKIIGIVFFCISLLGTAVIIEAKKDLTEVLRKEFDDRSLAISEELANRTITPMIIGDNYTLLERIKEIANYHDNVHYVLVFNDKKELIAHNFDKAVPNGLLNIRKWPVELVDIVSLDTNEGPIMDLARPILNGKVGYIQIGFSEQKMLESIREKLFNMAWVTLGVSIVGVVFANFVSYWITRPLYNLVKATKGISKGDFTQQVKIESLDEVGELGKTFNDMAQDLEKYTDELKEKEKIRIELIKKVISVQEEERKRIARELHDETGQSLTSLTVGLRVLSDRAENEKNKEIIFNLQEITLMTLKEVHQLAVELRPLVLDDGGLIAALQRYVKEYTEKNNIQVDFHVREKNDTKIPDDVETTVYRIIQEALTNITKHAKAQKVNIILEINLSQINLIIEDDGIGFNGGAFLQSKDHLGLQGMKERVNLLGGRINIESNAGRGTVIIVGLPFHHEGEL